MATDLLLQRGEVQTGYRLSTASQWFDRVRHGEDPWIACGDLLDDWRRAEPDQRVLLIAEPIQTAESDPQRRWAALFAAGVDWLSALRTWQLVESPTPFRMRRIDTDASVVARALTVMARAGSRRCVRWPMGGPDGLVVGPSSRCRRG
jgi:hypothetical protein